MEAGIGLTYTMIHVLEVADWLRTIDATNVTRDPEGLAALEAYLDRAADVAIAYDVPHDELESVLRASLANVALLPRLLRVETSGGASLTSLASYVDPYG